MDLRLAGMVLLCFVLSLCGCEEDLSAAPSASRDYGMIPPHDRESEARYEVTWSFVEGERDVWRGIRRHVWRHPSELRRCLGDPYQEGRKGSVVFRFRASESGARLHMAEGIPSEAFVCLAEAITSWRIELNVHGEAVVKFDWPTRRRGR